MREKIIIINKLLQIGRLRVIRVLRTACFYDESDKSERKCARSNQCAIESGAPTTGNRVHDTRTSITGTCAGGGGVGRGKSHARVVEWPREGR